MRRLLLALCAGVVWGGIGAALNPSLHPLRLVFHNPSEVALRDVQLPFVLAMPHPRHAHRLRVHDADGRAVNFWIESTTASSVHGWVKLPHLPPLGMLTLGVSYAAERHAEDLSSGRRTFEMFDDFGQPGLGYYRFGPPTTIMTRSLPWETEAPHTLSVVELARGGYRFWGYYGLANCGGIGLARSNDLIHWDKWPQPLLSGEGERWPSALRVGDVVYVAYDRDHCGTSHIVLRTTHDGLTLSAPPHVLVKPQPGMRNQNPALFRDPNTGLFHLYWFRGGSEAGFWEIRMRTAGRVEQLSDPTSERVVLRAPYELAAPNMLFHNNTYFLSTEVNEHAWKTKIYAGRTPYGPFTPLPDAPQLSDNQACLFQHVFDSVIHGYICKVIGTEWVLQHRAANPRAGRVVERRIDEGVWTALSGSWRTHADGRNVVLVGQEPGLLRTALIGSDLVFEARARGDWGLAVRVQDARNYLGVRYTADDAAEASWMHEGLPIVLGRAALATNQTDWQHVGLEAQGEWLRLWLGDVLALEVKLPPEAPTVGHAAVWSVGRAEFDDVRWRKPLPFPPLAGELSVKKH
ncbi:MAG: DUF2341 domain-containing protein [Thermoflexales bacterium]